MPPCLAERAALTGSVFCHLCGVVLASAADALSHNAEKHSSPTESTTCCYCGMVLPSPVALAMHQMVVDLSARWALLFDLLSPRVNTGRHISMVKTSR